jgi:hypothetical protein
MNIDAANQHFVRIEAHLEYFTNAKKVLQTVPEL